MKKTVAGIGAVFIGAAALFANVDAGVNLGWQPVFPAEGKTGVFGLDSNLFIGVSDSSIIPLGVEANIGLFGMSAKVKGGGITVKADVNYVELGLLLKCPIQASPSLYVSPSVGFSRQILTEAKVTEGSVSTTIKRRGMEDVKSLDFTAIKFGVSSDYLLNDNLFVRGSILYGILLDDVFGDNDSEYHGPIFSIGAGYRFI